MGNQTQSPTFALDEELWFGDDDEIQAESRAAASLAAVGARIVGAKPFPIAARRLDELTRNPTTRIEQVVAVLESDPALSVRLLRLVNSAGYGLKVRCSSVRHAAVLVGTRRLNQVATTAAILDLFDGSSSLGMELLEHATVVGSLCRYLAVHLGLPHDELFTCGFLHDIGKLMLLDSERERYAELLTEYGQAPDQIHIAERKLFGFDHAVLGAHVLKAWNIPEPVPRVIAWHHSPARALQDTVLAGMVETLRLADTLAYLLPMADARLAIDLVAAGDAAQYLEISDVQLAAMWDDLRGLRERSRARSHGEPELDVMVPKAELGSLSPQASRAPVNSSGPRSTISKGARPLHEVPTHFPCSVCAKPSYGNVCSACGGQVCPEHQIGADEWCTTCVREYARFKKSSRLSSLSRIGVGLLVGVTLSVAVVSAARAPGVSAESVVLAPLMVLALWAVVLPVAHRLWRKLAFLESRRQRSNIDALPIARPQNIPIQSVTPPEALPTIGPPEASLAPLLFNSDDRSEPGSEPVLSVAPLSMAPLSMAPLSMAPASLAPRSQMPASVAPISPRMQDASPNSLPAPGSAGSIPASMRPVWEDAPSLIPSLAAPVIQQNTARTYESCSVPAPAPASLTPSTSRSAMPKVAVPSESQETSAEQAEAAPASVTRISTRAPKPAESPLEEAPLGKRSSELPRPEVLSGAGASADLESEPRAEVTAEPISPELSGKVIDTAPAIGTAPTLLAAPRVQTSVMPTEAEATLRAELDAPSLRPEPSLKPAPSELPEASPAPPSLRSELVVRGEAQAAADAPVEESSALPDAEGVRVSSQPSGAHPVLRFPVERQVNSPLSRARAIACGKTVMFACTFGGQAQQNSIAPVAPGSRESA